MSKKNGRILMFTQKCQTKAKSEWMVVGSALEKLLMEKKFLKPHYKGFQEHSEIQADSPTGSTDSLRLLLSIISSRQWTLKSTDIWAAFPQERYRERCLYCATCRSKL